MSAAANAAPFAMPSTPSRPTRTSATAACARRRSAATSPRSPACRSRISPGSRARPACSGVPQAAERGFCRECGTPLSFRYVDKDRIAMSLGSLDDPARVPRRAIRHREPAALRGELTLPGAAPRTTCRPSGGAATRAGSIPTNRHERQAETLVVPSPIRTGSCALRRSRRSRLRPHLHAGDIGSPDVLDRLGALAPLRAVRGNVDTPTWAPAS